MNEPRPRPITEAHAAPGGWSDGVRTGLRNNFVGKRLTPDALASRRT